MASRHRARRVLGTALVTALLCAGTAALPASATPRTSPTTVDAGDGAVTVARWAGSDRYATAAAVSRNAFPDGHDVAYVASGEDYPDGLTAAAASSGPGPVLLVTRDALPDATADELRRLRPSRVTVVGGGAAIPSAVSDEITDITGAPVGRRSGADRYSTALIVAADYATVLPTGREVHLASGWDFPDALAAGAAAGSSASLMLLTAPDTLPEYTLRGLELLEPSSVTIVGGPSAVQAAVVDQLTALSIPTTRTAGADRYATAAAVSARTYPGGAQVAYLATGSGYADALAVGGVAAFTRGPVLLARPTCLPASTADELERLAVERVVVVGGTGVLGEGVAQQRRCRPGE